MVAPPYGARGGTTERGGDETRWLRREAAFGLGGAFPEVNVVQFPCGMGWCERNDAVGCREGEGEAAPGCLEMGFETLSGERRGSVRGGGDGGLVTKGFSSTFVCARGEWRGSVESGEDWRSMCARVGGFEKSERVRRVRNIGADALEAALVAGEGEPSSSKTVGKIGRRGRWRSSSLRLVLFS